MSFQQSPRRPEDGAVSIKRPDDGFVLISAVSAGKEEQILVSEYNASRILGMLAVMLGVSLNKADAKAIKL